MQSILDSFSKSEFNWIKQDVPKLPNFFDSEEILSIISKVKARLYDLLFDAWITVFNRHGLPIADFVGERDLVIASLITKRYGTVYFASRYEVNYIKEHLLSDDQKSRLLTAIEAQLTEERVNKIFNLAVYKFLLHKAQFLRFSSYRIPAYCFSPVCEEELYVNEEDFTSLSGDSLLNVDEALYDLHDFAHFVCVKLNSELYGCKLYSSFVIMNDDLKELITNSDIEKEGVTDNFIFRTLSQSLYEEISRETDIQAEKVLYIAKKIFRLFCTEPIQYTNRKGETHICQTSLLTIKQLMVLAQNKACEHSASEMEEQLMIRGGMPQDKDPLFNLSCAEFVQTVQAQKDLFYFEERNVIRHRAHKYAYSLFCSHILRNLELSPSDTLLVTEVRKHLEFIDYMQGYRSNLNNLIINEKFKLNKPNSVQKHHDEFVGTGL